MNANTRQGLNQRGWDLLRQMRHKLLEEQLISEDEYTYLLTQVQGSVKRLEDYDKAVEGRKAAQIDWNKHWPVHKDMDGKPILSRTQCACGKAVADGVRPYRVIWAEHMAELAAQSGVRQLREQWVETTALSVFRRIYWHDPKESEEQEQVDFAEIKVALIRAFDGLESALRSAGQGQHGWNIEQILVYIWQCISEEQSEQEYPYERFANSEMGKRLRIELSALAAASPSASERVREAAQAVIEWENEYRTLNHLGRNPPHVFAQLAIALAASEARSGQ